MADLLITLSDGRTLRRTLTGEPQTIGRDAECEIPIDDPSASRHHARFVSTPEGYRVTDLGSKNGTLVNDVACTDRLLRDGDRVALGTTVAVFRDGAGLSEGSVVISDTGTAASHATRYVGRDKDLVLSRRRLEMIYQLGGRLTKLQHRDELLDNAMDICFETLRFERGAIGLRQRRGRGVDWPVVRNLRGREGELTISRTLLSRALEHGERAIFTDVGGGSADPTVSMVQHGIRSAMCVPLLDRDGTLGVLYGDRTTTSTQYTDEDIDFFAAIAGQVAIGLINTRLVEDQKDMIRMSRDLDLARTIQTGLFPREMPNRDGLRVAALNEPGHGVSGDYYDVIERPDGRCWLLMADVTGEGIAAALLMANLQAAARVTIDRAEDPGAVLTRLNALIHRNTASSKFITALLALIDPKERTVTFSNAGHCPPLLVRADGSPPREPAHEPNFPLGVVEATAYASHTVDLRADPVMFFCFTDGVIEAMDPEGRQYGMERLSTALAEGADKPPSTLVKHIRKSVSTFVGPAPQSDDITILAARIG